MSSGKAVQGERTAIFAHLLRFFWLVSRCFAGMVRRGQKLSPRRNETPEKNFFKTARILGRQHRRALAAVTVPCRALASLFELRRRRLLAFSSAFLSSLCFGLLCFLCFALVCVALVLAAVRLPASLVVGLAYFMAC